MKRAPVGLLLVFVVCRMGVSMAYAHEPNQGLIAVDAVRRFVFDPVYGNLGDFFMQSGAKMERLVYTWKEIETTKDVYNWSDLDNKVKVYNNYGIPIALFWDAAPEWAIQQCKDNPDCQISNCLEPLDESDFSEWREFVTLTAERYDGDGYNDAPGSPVVEYFELTNEPDSFLRYSNQDDYNQNGKPDYQDYAIMQKIYYEAIKTANSYAVVGFSGLAAENCCGFDIEFLEKVLSYSYSQWQRQFFDVLPLHYYENYFFSWSVFDSYSGGGIRGKIAWANEVMARYGAADKKIIFTEVGYPLAEVNNVAEEEKQADLIMKIFSRAFSAAPGPFFWFSLKDYPNNYYGLIREDDTKRPSFTAYQVMASNLKDYVFNHLDGASGIEGYLFNHRLVTGNFKEVIWSKSLAGVNKVFEADKVKITDRNNTSQWVTDGSLDDYDRLVNGMIKLFIGSSPKIVEWGDWVGYDLSTGGQLSPSQHNFETTESFYSWSSDTGSGSLVDSLADFAYQGEKSLKTVYLAGNQGWGIYTNLNSEFSPTAEVVAISGEYYVASVAGSVSLRVCAEYWTENFASFLGFYCRQLPIKIGEWQEYNYLAESPPQESRRVKLSFTFNGGSGSTVYFDELEVDFLGKHLLRYDFNRNSKVESGDFALLVNSWQKRTFTPEDVRYDIDTDGVVNAFDYAWLRRAWN